MGINDLNYRMQKMNATLDELKEFAGQQTLDFTEEETAVVAEGMNEIERLRDSFKQPGPVTHSGNPASPPWIILWSPVYEHVIRKKNQNQYLKIQIN